MRFHSGVDQADIEGEAEALLRFAHQDGEELGSIVALAESLLGRGCIESVYAEQLPGDALLVERTIFVRTKLSRERVRFAVSHELAEWRLRESGYIYGDIEAAADRMAAALSLPRRPFMRKLGAYPTFLEAAQSLESTPTCVALRYGEVTNQPVIVYGPGIQACRGAEWLWPPLRLLRQWAEKGVPGVWRADLDKGRVMLIAMPEPA